MKKSLDELLTGAPRWSTMRSDAWMKGLRDLCDEYVSHDSVVVELGSYAGESTVVFAGACKHVYAIDPWSRTYEKQLFEGCGNSEISSTFEPDDVPSMELVEQIFDARIAPYHNVTKIRGSSEEIVDRFPDGSLDLVYIDSIHTFDVVDLNVRLWLPKLRSPGGVMAGHDYSEQSWPGVVAAVAKTFGRPDRTFDDTSWAVRVDQPCWRRM